jgi:hypothetical protein
MNEEYITVERYKRLVDFVNELVRNYNELERRVAALEKQPIECGNDLQPEIPFEAGRRGN